MHDTRATWMRTLLLGRGACADDDDGPGADVLDAHVHARSRFRSLADPEAFAVYTVHGVATAALAMAARTPAPYRLVAVREFRRVPLHAASLALMLVRARPGFASRVVGALAGFVERIVERHEPAYLLVAHCRERPDLAILLAGVDVGRRPADHAPLADAIRPEVGPLLTAEPDWFAYWPEPWPAAVGALVSPYAV